MQKYEELGETNELFLKSLDLYFNDCNRRCPFLDFDNYSDTIYSIEWSNGYKAHDYGNEYESEEERMEESFYSTYKYLSLSELFIFNEWYEDYNDKIYECLEVAKIWMKLGFTAHIMDFRWSRNYTITGQNLKYCIECGSENEIFEFNIEDCLCKDTWNHIYIERN